MIQIRQITPEELDRYSAIPQSYQVESVLRVGAPLGGLGGLTLTRKQVTPYLKDYDHQGPGQAYSGPLTWPEEFDIRNWAIFLAEEDGKPVGGAAVAFNTSGVNMLEGSRDLAVLWDIRVLPERWGQGIGRMLFWDAAHWAKAQGCSVMKVETQNVNVPACRFYLRQGCTLGSVHRYAYRNSPGVEHEVMLLWYLDLRKH